MKSSIFKLTQTLVRATLLPACAVLLGMASCKKDNNPVPVRTPAEILASTKWKTTVVKDSVGRDLTSSNMNFVGIANYNTDGTFFITNFDGVLRLQGTWAITGDGNKRIFVTPNFTNIVDIVTLNERLFTYRTRNADGIRVDVEHVPAK